MTVNKLLASQVLEVRIRSSQRNVDHHWSRTLSWRITRSRPRPKRRSCSSRSRRASWPMIISLKLLVRITILETASSVKPMSVRNNHRLWPIRNPLAVAQKKLQAGPARDLVLSKIYPCIGEVWETKSSCRSYHSFKAFHRRARMRKGANNTRGHTQDMHLNFIILIPIRKEDRK